MSGEGNGAGKVLGAATAAVLPSTFGNRWTLLSVALLVALGAVLAGVLASKVYRQVAR